MTGLALGLILIAMILIRMGWGGRTAFAPSGWTLAIIGLGLLTWQSGAWGMAVGATLGMTAALALVLYEGWQSPARPARPSREAPAVTLTRVPRDVIRRIAVFLVVVPVGFAAALWLTYALQALLRNSGTADANSIALTWFAQPILWSVLMSWQMTRTGPLAMLSPAIFTALLGLILWSIG